MNLQPIGIFDSGIGGTTVWREIHKLLPNESTIYVADSFNAPYGDRSRKEIIDLSMQVAEYLLNQGSKIIVVACNTVTTNAIQELRAKYAVPFIGIEPAIKPAALHTATGVVGVLATKGTLASELFFKTSGIYANGIKVIEQVGEGLVSLIEKGQVDSDKMYSLLQKYIVPMVEANADTIVLGCTHYPYLIPLIKKIAPHLNIIDSGFAVAKHTRSVMEQYNLLSESAETGTNTFYTTGDTTLLTSFLKDVEDPDVKKLNAFKRISE